MSFEDNMLALGAETSAVVLALWEQYQASALSLEEFQEAAAIVVDTGRVQGAVLGALTVAAYLEVLTGAGVPVQAPRLPSVVPKLLAAMVTISTGQTPIEPERVPMQLERLATAEVQNGAQQGMQDAIEDSPEAEGWTRGLDAGACEFCRDLKAGERRTMPKGTRMARHPKCACTPLPTVSITTQTLVVNEGSVYRRGVGWMTRAQAAVFDETGVVPALDTLPPRQFVPAGSLTDEQLATFPKPKGR